MTAYYLSNAGNDAASGTSPDQPWVSIARLNAALAANQVIGGDAVLFRRGDTFYGSPTHSGHLGYPNTGWTLYGAYGSGARPKISCYKIAKASGWQDQGSGVWRINLAANSGAYTGAVDVAATDVGHLRVDGKIYGAKKDSVGALSAPWDFYSGDYAGIDVTGYLYVKSNGNPSSGRIVEIAPQSGAIINIQRHRTLVQGMEIFGGDGGIYGNSYWAPKNVVVRDCEIHALGGGYLRGYQYPTRGGNGVQAWIGNSDWLIERNSIYDCYDVAVTYQGDQGNQVATNKAFTRLNARQNRIWNNCQSFEMWSKGTDGAGFVDCSFSDNVCFNAGGGWGQAVRPDPVGRGCHILIYESELPCDVSIERNLFFGAATGYMFALNGVPAAAKLRNNKIFFPEGLPIQTSTIVANRRSETVSQAPAYVAATSREQGSQWFATRAAAEAYLNGRSQGAGQIIRGATGLRRKALDTSWPTI
jgi:hypothetical protein